MQRSFHICGLPARISETEEPIMSRQLSLSTALCAFAMALFVLTARAGMAVDANANGAAGVPAAPLAAVEITS